MDDSIRTQAERARRAAVGQRGYADITTRGRSCHQEQKGSARHQPQRWFRRQRLRPLPGRRLRPMSQLQLRLRLLPLLARLRTFRRRKHRGHSKCMTAERNDPGRPSQEKRKMTWVRMMTMIHLHGGNHAFHKAARRFRTAEEAGSRIPTLRSGGGNRDEEKPTYPPACPAEAARARRVRTRVRRESRHART